jgi:beta-alanine--pyruvate transaminase
MKGERHVIDIRNLGLMGAIELEPRPREPIRRAYETFLKVFEAGILIRSTADVLAFSPPLIVEKEQITRIFEAVRAALKTVQ